MLHQGMICGNTRGRRSKFGVGHGTKFRGKQEIMVILYSLFRYSKPAVKQLAAIHVSTVTVHGVVSFIGVDMYAANRNRCTSVHPRAISVLVYGDIDRARVSRSLSTRPGYWSNSRAWCECRRFGVTHNLVEWRQFVPSTLSCCLAGKVLGLGLLRRNSAPSAPVRYPGPATRICCAGSVPRLLGRLNALPQLPDDW